MMKKVFCPKTQKEEWANEATKSATWRCTKCGEIHGSVKK